MLLQEKAHGEKFVLSLLHPTGRQSARQRRADICASHIEQVRQGLGMVAVAREARFQSFTSCVNVLSMSSGVSGFYPTSPFLPARG